MAVVKLTNFGGLRPRATARSLPDDSAQTANNLLATTQEFRPLQDDTVAVASSGVNNPATIYRLQRNADGSYNTNFSSAAKWQISAIDKSFVKGQLNDNTTERTYVTFNDASQAPRVIDATGSDRQLGVPAPTTAPTVTVNVVAQFDSATRTTELQAALQTVLDAVHANAIPVWRGAAHPGTSTPGYADATAANNFVVSNDAVMGRAYRLSGVGGTVTNSYCSADPSQFSWIFDPLLGGSPGTAGSTPSWAGGAGTPHYVLEFSAYGLTYDINATAISTAISAILMPGKTDGTKLFTPTQVTDMVTSLQAVVDPAGPVKPLIDALSSKVQELKVLLDGGQVNSLVATTEAFYSKSDVVAAIASSIANAAEGIFAAAAGIAASSLPPDFGGAGNAGV